MKKEYKWNKREISPGHKWIDPVVLQLIDDIRPKRILDLGCGNGVLTRSLHARGYEVVGVDPSESGIKDAIEQSPTIPFHVCGVYDDPNQFGLGKFDLIVSEEVVEHLYYPDELLVFARKALNPQGRIIITTPYYGYLRNLALAVFNRWDHHLTPLWTHGHIKLFSYNTMKKLLGRNNFRLLKFTGAGNFRFFWRSMVVLAEPMDSSFPE
jgi:2-polyprenyl-3-methyl-5-hydroxy-6-metoxy-1,4-benzoquinol methylase